MTRVTFNAVEENLSQLLCALQSFTEVLTLEESVLRTLEINNAVLQSTVEKKIAIVMSITRYDDRRRKIEQSSLYCAPYNQYPALANLWLEIRTNSQRVSQLIERVNSILHMQMNRVNQFKALLKKNSLDHGIYDNEGRQHDARDQSLRKIII